VADKQHWSRVGEAGTILGMKILLAVYRLTGRFGFRLVLVPVMLWYFLLRRDAREASRQYLQRLQQHTGSVEGPGHAFRHFLAFGESLLDKFLVWMGHIRREDVVFENPQAIEQLDRQQTGGLIVVSHQGNIEVCSALAHQLPDVRLTVLVHTHHAVRFNQLLKKVNSSNRIEMMQVTDMSPATAMLLSERVAAGEYVVIAGDRTPVTDSQRNSQVQFLGHTAPLPQGAVILAGLLQCPIYLMFCLKQQQRYHIYLESFADAQRLPRRNREQWINEQVQRYASRLEHYCSVAPLQWFNFYPFWNDNERASDEVASSGTGSP